MMVSYDTAVYIFDIDKQDNTVYGLVEKNGVYVACAMPTWLSSRLPLRIGLEIDLRISQKDGAEMDIADIHATSMPAREHLERVLRFEEVHVDYQRTLPRKGSKRKRFFAFGNSGLHKRVRLYEGYFDNGSEADSVVRNVRVMCLPVEPTEKQKEKGHVEYHGAFPRIIR